MENGETHDSALTPYLSQLGAWAFALGTTIGWGSLVVTSSSYLSHAGPLGSTLGLLVGFLVMLAVARNFHYLIGSFPEAGGIYTYVRNVFGYDRAFLAAWFALLTYLAIFWANATSVPLFARYFIGDLFEFGFMYELFGYDVYLGEVLLTIAAIVLFGIVCAKSKRAAMIAMIAMAFVIVIGVAACFFAAMFNLDLGAGAFNPAFLPDGNTIVQVIYIACISPWAFIGFENVSNSAEEFRFSRTKSFRVMVAAIVTATVLYIFVTLLSVTAYPAEYGSWFDYIKDLGNISGLKALPAFYAADHYLGNAGVFLLTAALLALVITSLIGNLIAMSRMLFALGRDNVIPQRFSRVNAKGIPHCAVNLIVAVSLVVPFLGRTAIGWIVDVTTIGAALIYCFVSAAAFKLARQRGDKLETATGAIGFLVMLALEALVLFLLPSVLGINAMASESYLLFTVWAMLGFVTFRFVMKRDPLQRFGKSLVVWVALLSLIMFTSLLWMDEYDLDATVAASDQVQEYFAEAYGDSTGDAQRDAYVDALLGQLHATKTMSTVLVMAMFGFSLIMLLSNFTYVRKRGEEAERQLGEIKTVAYTDPLTGVKSKHAYVEYEASLDEALRAGTLSELAVVVCDVNGLKQINDTLGHKAGDAYIKSGATLVCELFKRSPVFRIGGDEFVVIAEGADYENRKDIMAEFNRRVEENLQGDGVVISAGIAEYLPELDHSVHYVFERADAMMYQHKMKLKSMGAAVRD